MESPFAERRAGVLCPVFALRREGDLGIGDTASVRGLIDWAARCGLRFVQFLPINATGRDNSPYNAISSIALEPLTLELSPEAVPELAAEEFETIRARHAVDEAPATRVDYDRVRALKGELMDAAHDRLCGAGAAGGFLEGRRRAFEAFRAAEAAWLDDFCLFGVLMDRAGNEDWPQWPEAFNTGARARAWLVVQKSAHPAGIEKALSRQAYAQWLCAQQWAEVRDYAKQRRVGLMGDVPFGISWCSADVFFHPEEFDLDWCGGAPPESYFKDDLFVQKWGQNWGIPLYDWARMEAGGFWWWRRRIGKLTDVFGMFRIDHVLGFYRIYSFPWRPARNDEFLPLTEAEAAARCAGRLPRFLKHPDDTAEHKAANLEQGDRFLKMIVAAATGAEVVAEDLGTVPDYVRPHLAALDIPGFKICQWEDDGHGNTVQGAQYPNCSFTTFGTHDHEPMSTLWERLRREVEAGDPGAAEDAARQLRFLCQFAWLHPETGPYPPYDERICRALLQALFNSASRMAAFTLTDLFGAEIRFNVPGIAADRNWSARLPMTVQELQEGEEWKQETDWLREAVRASGRGG